MTSQTTQQRLPINNYHAFVLTAATDPLASPIYHEKNIIRWASRIRPGLKERSVQRAFGKLVSRHDALRQRFVPDGDSWSTTIEAAHPQGLLVRDISHLSEAEQDAEVLRQATTTMTALSWPLFEMVLFKGGDAGDVLMARAQHVILDGYSVVILIEDMLKLILRMPLGAAPPPYAQYIQRNLSQAREDHDIKAEFWRQSLLPATPDLEIGRKARGLPPVSWTTTGRTINMANALSTAESAALAHRAKEHGLTPFIYLYAAYAEALCAIAGATQVMINSVVGRADLIIKDIVCADQQAIGIRYICDPGKLDARAHWLSGMLKQAIAASPTNALLHSGPVLPALEAAGETWFRFLAHAPHPTGRMARSPFGKLFDLALNGDVSFGPFRFQPLDLSNRAEIDTEVQMTVHDVAGQPNFTLYADEAGYDRADLTAIGEGMRAQLRH